MFLCVTWWCTHSFESLNSTTRTYKPRPVIQLHRLSNQQHPCVAMPKAICENRPQDSRVSTTLYRKHNFLSSPGQVNTPPHLQPGCQLSHQSWQHCPPMGFIIFIHIPNTSPHPTCTGRLHYLDALSKNHSQNNIGFVVCLRFST